MPPLSPLAPAAFPAMPPVAGVRLATCEAGVRYHGRTDLTLVELAPGTTAAGVLTRSKTAAAPVDWCRAALADGLGRALVVSAGNANAFTGRAGDAAVRYTAQATAALFGAAPEDVFIAQTGVIGEPMDPDKILESVRQWNKDTGIVIHTIAVHTNEVGTYFLQRLAAQNGGIFVERKGTPKKPKKK